MLSQTNNETIAIPIKAWPRLIPGASDFPSGIALPLVTAFSIEKS
jgi:hypothetical protein